MWSTSTMPVEPGEVEQHAAEHGTLAPHTPLRPAAAVTGTRASLHSRSTAATSAAECGRTITDAARGDLVVERPDHRERPPVAARLADLGGARSRPSAPVAASCVAQRVVDLDACGCRGGRGRRRVARERDRRSRRAPVRLHAGETTEIGLRRWVRQRVERGLGQPAGRALGRRSARGTRSTWRSRSASVQPSSAAMSAATSSARPRPTRRARAGGRGCGARARRRRCGPSRRAPRTRPRPASTARPGTIGSASARVGASSASTSRAVAAVARREVRREVGRVPAVGAVQARRASCGCAPPRCRAASTTASTVSAAMRRYVVSLPPVTVTTPLADVCTECRRERSAVRSLLAARDERAQAGPRAEDVGLGDRRGDRAVDRAQEVRDVVGRDLRIVDRSVVVGVGRADVGEPVVAAVAAPRHDEHRTPVLRHRDHGRDLVAHQRPRHRDVHALRGPDRRRVRALVERAHVVGPHAGRVHDELRAHRRSSLPSATTRAPLTRPSASFVEADEASCSSRSRRRSRPRCARR